MKKIFFVLLSFSKYFSKYFSPTAFRLGVPISLHGLFLIRLFNFGQVNRGSINYIVATSSSELHLQHYTFLRPLFFREGHGGSIKQIK